MTHSLNVCLEHTPLVGHMCTSLTMVYLWAAHKQQKIGKAETEEQGIVSRLRCPFQCPHFCWFRLLQDPVLINLL